MNPLHWRYVAEGGKNAVFCYRGEDDDKFQGRVLRIEKTDLATSVESNDDDNDNGQSVAADSKRFATSPPPPNETIQFLSNIIRPLIGEKYVDLPETISLNGTFLRGLYDQTMKNNVIPLNRMNSWKSDDDETTTTTRAYATLLTDYTNLVLPTTSSIHDKSRCMSIEIKPKAGFIQCTPLIHPRGCQKMRYTEFAIKQHLMTAGHLPASGWGSSSSHEQKSLYSPLDLFSNHRSYMKRALMALTDSMQNNLRIWHEREDEGPMLFGHGVQDPSEAVCTQILKQFFSSKSLQGKKDLLTTIVDTVANVLEKESSFLTNLLSLQRLDVLDEDGAVRVYRRLVHLCNDSQKEAERLLDEYSVLLSDNTIGDEEEEASKTVSMLFENSPYTLSQKCDTLEMLCQNIQEFRARVQPHGPQTAATTTRYEEAFDEAMELVQKLDRRECLFLLANWLLSLCARDVSFFVSLRRLDEDDSVSSDIVTISPLDDEDVVVFVAYSVKVVDCGPKPAVKLRNRTISLERTVDLK